MANIKFSAFTQKVASADVDFLVGYTGGDNIRIAPSVFDDRYLPLAGGTMTGDIVLEDSVELGVGTDSDLRIYHNGTNNFILNTVGNLNIRQTAAGGNITFQSDDGAGGYDNYFIIDGGNTQTQVYQDFRWQDDIKASFGNGSDLQIYHDGSNSYIKDIGTGNLRISGTQVDILNTDANEFKARFITDGAVELYYDAVKKFETTSTGIDVDGDVLIKSGEYISWGTVGATSIEGSTASNKLQFRTNSADRMVIDTAGNVGIGTSSPSRKLEVSGVGSSAPTFIKILGDTSNEAVLELHADNDAAGDRWRIAASNSAKLQFRSNGSNLLSITSAGNVGIGTTSPSHNLQVENSGNAEIQAQRTSGAGVLIQAQSAVGVVGTNTNHRLDLKTNGGTRMSISNAGDVGIGTSSPASKLEVDGGDIEVDDSASGLILRSPDGTRYRVTVANGGTLTVSVA